MLRKMLKSPVGITGVILLPIGLLLAFNYDPKPYEQQDTIFITNPHNAAKVAVENQRKSQARDQELIMIWGNIGFGLLMLGSAAWKASRSIPDINTINTEGETKRTK